MFKSRGFNGIQGHGEMKSGVAWWSKRGIWWIMRKFGGKARQWAWDDQFASGRWTHLKSSPELAEFVTDLAKGGKVVDCGCGEGRLLDALYAVDQEPRIGDYEGFDVSSVAIDAARARHPDTNFYVADMAQWAGTRDAAVVVAEESTYYLSPSERPRFMETAFRSLAPGGVLVCVFHDEQKNAEVIAALEAMFPSKRHKVGTRCALVFEGRAQSAHSEE